MAVVDAVARLLPGSLADDRSSEEESFSPALDGALEYPHYTRPAEFRGHARAGGAALGPPRAHRRVAPRAGRRRAAPTPAGADAAPPLIV